MLVWHGVVALRSPAALAYKIVGMVHEMPHIIVRGGQQDDTRATRGACSTVPSAFEDHHREE